jgi:P27 family predicted phage terminase small subunit
MGLRGPPKKPTALKIIQGIPGGKHKLTPDEPQPELTKDAEPVFILKPIARKFWDKIVPILEESNILTHADLNALTRYCEAFGRWVEAKEFLEKKGETYTLYHDLTEDQITDGKTQDDREIKYIVQYPQVNIYSSLLKDLLKYEQQFGLTPAARASISAPLKKKSEDNRSKLYGTK